MKDVAAGTNVMIVLIECEADQMVVCSGFIGLTVPDVVLNANEALTAVQTISYKVTE